MYLQLYFSVLLCAVVAGKTIRHLQTRQSSSYMGGLLRPSRVVAAMLFALLTVGPALAAPFPGDRDDAAALTTDDPQTDKPSKSTSDVPSAPPKDFRDTSGMVTTKGGFMTGIGRRSGLLGNEWGLRKWLSKYGASLNVFETSEALGNFTGGTRRGVEYDGLTQMIFQVDTQRAFHLYGGTFNVSALQIHGSNLSELTLSNLQTASGIESNRATRLWELWYDQKFGKSNSFDLKIGQQSLDQEFMVSQNALLFVNTMFGWPMVPSADMPGGGPAYPLAALGVRARFRPLRSVTVLAGAFNGNPASPNADDAQEWNSSGARFPLNGGVMGIAEVQYTYPALGSMVYPGKREPLARVYKLGAWYNSEKFADQRLDSNGISLSSPISNGTPRMHRGDYSIYAVADQMIWQHKEEYNRAVNVFVRAMGTPQTNRNLVDFSLNAGLTFNEPILHRDGDVFGVGMGFAHVSGQAAALDKDFGLLDPSYPVRSGETFIETTYRYVLRPWCQLQPTFQYVFNPGGGILNSNSSAPEKIHNEAIAGLRINIAF